MGTYTTPGSVFSSARARENQYRRVAAAAAAAARAASPRNRDEDARERGRERLHTHTRARIDAQTHGHPASPRKIEAARGQISRVCLWWAAREERCGPIRAGSFAGVRVEERAGKCL